jgi:regulator of protease activity HflC (stomatin/prohibitin superfamily)
MMKSKLLFVLFLLFVGTGCLDRVESGYVGVKVYTLGSDKGEIEVLGTGKYYIGWNEELHRFPVFQQNYTWEKSSKDGGVDESIVFQTVEGMQVGADVGISFHLDREKIGTIFQTYRRGVEEITDTFLRNHVRDALNAAGSKLTVESVYGSGKTDLIAEVEKNVKEKVEPTGIIVDKIYLIGSFRLPKQITQALNDKMGATQRAQQRQNEVAEAKAEADKAVEQARGRAESAKLVAQQEADSLLITAEAQAKANRVLSESLSPNLIQYKQIEKWNGVLPVTTLGSGTGTLLGVK